MLNLVALTLRQALQIRRNDHLAGWFDYAELGMRLFMLGIESQNKKQLLFSQYQQFSPEETSGLLSRTFFWWINPLLRKGTRMLLVGSDLPHLDGTLAPETLRTAMLRCWDQRGEQVELPRAHARVDNTNPEKPESKKTLPMALARCLSAQLTPPILPRLVLIFCRYGQAVLIGRAVRYVTVDRDRASSCTAYTLIAGAMVVYLGMTVRQP